jgi:hypothetical protein
MNLCKLCRDAGPRTVEPGKKESDAIRAILVQTEQALLRECPGVGISMIT